MPQSVHRLLVHGKDAVKQLSNLQVTIGESSEEALESRNKDHKYAREHHTRKISRSKTNEDQFHYMMVTSDPIISGLHSPQTEKRNSFPKSALALIKSGTPIYSEGLENTNVEEFSEDVYEEDQTLGSDELEEDLELMSYEDMNIDLEDYYFAN